MKRVLVAAMAVMATASVASAQLLTQASSPYLNKGDIPAGQSYDVDGAEAGLQCVYNLGPAPGTPFSDPIVAVTDPDNLVVNLDLAACLGLASGTPLVMNGIGWNVQISTVGASWVSEAQIYFDDNIAPDLSGLFLNPGAGNNAPGQNVPFASPVLKFGPGTPIPGIPTISLPNGMLRMEFGDTFDDNVNAVDDFMTGTLTIQATPEPTTLALLGLGALGLIRRRR